VAVGGGGGVDGFEEVEGVDDAGGGEVEVFSDQFGDGVFIEFCGALAVDMDGGGFGDADGVTELDFTDIGEIGGDDIFGDVAGHVGGGAVDFGGVFAGEGAAAVSASSAVGVDDDFASGESAVAVGTAEFEFAGGVDMDGDVVVPPFAEDGFDDVLFDLGGQFIEFIIPLGAMLGGDDDGVDALGVVAVVFHGDLAFGIGAEGGDGTCFADFGLFFDEFVGEVDGEGHETVGFFAGETKHEALVARSLFGVQTFAGVDALGDVGRLLVEGDHDGATVVVEALVAVVVADSLGGVADGLGDVYIAIAGDFPGDDGEAGGDHGFAGDSGVGVHGEHGIENGIGDLVGHFVGMAHGDGFGGKKVGAGRHGNPLSVERGLFIRLSG